MIKSDHYVFKHDRCPECGSGRIGAGRTSSAAVINLKNALKVSGIIHEFCLDCGYIIASYVVNPETFAILKKGENK
jgi:hypothetical protein